MNKPYNIATGQQDWSLTRWLDYMLAIHPAEIDMELTRVRQVYQRLNLNWQNSKIITVGGTNGKGSTCRIVEAGLSALGHKVGVYSSPHLIDYRERVRVEGVSPPEQDFCAALQAIERARGDTTLTYFEFGTLAALLMLNKASLDFVILEVGLGGRLDATNIVDPNLAVVTTIGIDHQEYLGDTKESIAIEKAGIFRANIPLIIGEPEPPGVLIENAQSKSELVMRKGVSFSHHSSQDKSEAHWSWEWHVDERLISLTNLPQPRLAIDNVSTGLAVLAALGVLEKLSEDSLSEVITKTDLPGRFQQIAEKPNWYIDVAHNPQASELLVNHIAKVKSGRLFIIIGMMKDKAIAETLSLLKPLDAYWFPTDLDSPRAASAGELGQFLSNQKVVGEYPSVADAAKAVRQRVKEDDTVLVFGSFVTVADVLTLSRQGLT